MDKYTQDTWLEGAQCVTADPEIFFPPREKTLYKAIAAEAKTYCFGGNGKPQCPVIDYCLWNAVDNDEQHGILGGRSHRERNAVIRKWRRQYKDKMTLKEYIFQLDKKENNVSSKVRP